ncbi:hypothetical protein DFH27DRAFT_609567 [Peziza echinospora]|nr:hypothetical protein DFH27DRAFT_609567 [Peziza echinospora]
MAEIALSAIGFAVAHPGAAQAFVGFAKFFHECITLYKDAPENLLKVRCLGLFYRQSRFCPLCCPGEAPPYPTDRGLARTAISRRSIHEDSSLCRSAPFRGFLGLAKTRKVIENLKAWQAEFNSAIQLAYILHQMV